MMEQDYRGVQYFEKLKLNENRLKIIFKFTFGRLEARKKLNYSKVYDYKYSMLRNTVHDLGCNFDYKCKKPGKYYTCEICKYYNGIK